jgi:hypothetical protein
VWAQGVDGIVAMRNMAGCVPVLGLERRRCGLGSPRVVVAILPVLAQHCGVG